MIDTEKYEGYTPAPWAVFTSGDGDDIYMVDNRAVCDKDGKTIATIECPYCKEDEHLSYNNKILIADAPLLLEEVKRLQYWNEEMDRVIATLEKHGWGSSDGDVHEIVTHLLAEVKRLREGHAENLQYMLNDIVGFLDAITLHEIIDFYVDCKADGSDYTDVFRVLDIALTEWLSHSEGASEAYLQQIERVKQLNGSDDE